MCVSAIAVSVTVVGPASACAAGSACTSTSARSRAPLPTSSVPFEQAANAKRHEPQTNHASDASLRCITSSELVSTGALPLGQSAPSANYTRRVSEASAPLTASLLDVRQTVLEIVDGIAERAERVAQGGVGATVHRVLGARSSRIHLTQIDGRIGAIG